MTTRTEAGNPEVELYLRPPHLPRNPEEWKPGRVTAAERRARKLSGTLFPTYPSAKAVARAVKLLEKSGYRLSEGFGAVSVPFYTRCPLCGTENASVVIPTEETSVKAHILCSACDNLMLPDSPGKIVRSNLNYIRVYELWKDLKETFLTAKAPPQVLHRFRVAGALDPNMEFLYGRLGRIDSAVELRERISALGRTARNGMFEKGCTNWDGPALVLPICAAPGIILGFRRIGPLPEYDLNMYAGPRHGLIRKDHSLVFGYSSGVRRTRTFPSLQDFVKTGIPAVFSGAADWTVLIACGLTPLDRFRRRKYSREYTDPVDLLPDPIAHVRENRRKRADILGLGT